MGTECHVTEMVLNHTVGSAASDGDVSIVAGGSESKRAALSNISLELHHLSQISNSWAAAAACARAKAAGQISGIVTLHNRFRSS
jgi:hypothetical protein